jgi:hypothetical protein
MGGGQFAICCFRLTHTCKIPRELAVLKDKEWEGNCFTLMIAEVRWKESDVVTCYLCSGCVRLRWFQQSFNSLVR